MAERKKRVVNGFENSTLAYFNDINDCNPLSREEEIKLWKQYKENHDIEARNKLVKANLKYVIKVAKSFQGRGLSYADLIAEGNMGLLKGIERFDGTRGIKTLSYSIWWIRQAILEAINKRNGIDGDDFPDEGRILPEELDETDSEVISQYILDDCFIDKNEIQEKNNENQETIFHLISCLTDKERKIIEEYYGLNGKKPLTLEEIGDEMGLTKERVRQINEKALKKMRHEALMNSIS